MKATTSWHSDFLRPSLAVWAALAIVAWAACAPAPAPPVRSASAAEVEAAFKKFEEAWEREDLEAAASAFAPDAVVFDPVPPGRFERAEGIRAWISGSFDSLEQISINASQLRVQTAGPVAWATAHYVFEAQQQGKSARFEGDLTMVWVLQSDGSHKLSVFHASHLPVATGPAPLSYSPIGIVFDRAPGPAETLPFATWKISADWMEKGTFIEMMTPRQMPRAVSLSISSHAAAREQENEILARDPFKGAVFLHPNGARRLTGLRVVAPGPESLPPAASYIGEQRLVQFAVGARWLLDVTLDNGSRGVSRDFQPGLPMVVHY